MARKITTNLIAVVIMSLVFSGVFISASTLDKQKELSGIGLDKKENLKKDNKDAIEISNEEKLKKTEITSSIIIKNVWTDKAYYLKDEKATVFAKIVDLKGNPVSSNKLKVRFTLTDMNSGEELKRVYHMKYNEKTGYWEYSINKVSNGVWRINLEAVEKGRTLAKNSKTYFKVLESWQIVKPVYLKKTEILAQKN
ncbi:MAG: hypothetical protein AABX30_02880 [Nanoarchaeota archaeon]